MKEFTIGSVLLFGIGMIFSPPQSQTAAAPGDVFSDAASIAASVPAIEPLPIIANQIKQAPDLIEVAQLQLSKDAEIANLKEQLSELQTRYDGQVQVAKR